MNFDGVIGHERQKSFLGSLAVSGRIPQAMLFTGIPGIGKKLLAKRFIAGLFCAQPNPPCLSCPVCLQISRNTHPDYLELSPGEKGSIPIGSEDRREPGSVRWLIERLSRRAFGGHYGVIIDGAGAVGDEGQNALLKTIEEPSAGSVIILIASSRAGILPTIISRCVELKFHPLSDAEISRMMEADIPDAGRREIIALLSGGSPLFAGDLSDRETLEDLLRVAGLFRKVLEKEALFTADLDPLIKHLGSDKLLDVLLNLYRVNLLSVLGSIRAVPPRLAELFIEDDQKIRDLVKIFVALKKGQTHNLNFRLALKGMLYSLCSAPDHESAHIRDIP